MRRNRPNYGIDAPYIFIGYLIAGVACIGLSFWLKYLWITGVIFLLESLYMVWGSRVGKLRLRDKLINTFSWNGNERVLDVGCGHGLLLIGAAQRLPTGKVTGIDLWQKQDQAGNSREATMQNVRLENVADRIELIDGDARKLPFADNSFDAVVSSWALHNIPDKAGRAVAIQEIARVLKPGGRVLIIDIRHTSDYAEVFRQCKMMDVERSGPNFLFMIPSRTLTARKSPAA